MRFHYSITHVPGVELKVADALSRSPISSTCDEDNDFQNEVTAYVDMLVQNLPVTNKRLQEILTAQYTDKTCSQLKSYCRNGWPHRSKVVGSLKPFLPIRNELPLRTVRCTIPKMRIAVHHPKGRTLT